MTCNATCSLLLAAAHLLQQSPLRPLGTAKFPVHQSFLQKHVRLDRLL